jgi:2,3-diaminopropionate biosynthesis protein SbnA
MIASEPTELIINDSFVELPTLVPHAKTFLKLEGHSLTGSIKVKVAISMLEQLEAAGKLQSGGSVIESSSGNLGLALAMVCSVKNYQFTCVSDPNISSQTAKMIRAYGARLIIVEEQDANGGYLGSRIKLIRDLMAKNPSLVWTNQYENHHNVRAHFEFTAPQLLKSIGKIDFLFVGAGTTGTLGGVSQFFRLHSPATTVVAVDSCGSVTFGKAPGKRYIPGLGTSQPPLIRRESDFDDLLMIEESDTVQMCHYLAKRGLLLGGSTGTVLCAVHQYSSLIPKCAVVAAISPDFGDRYVETIYNFDWVKSHFPELPLEQLGLSLPASRVFTQSQAGKMQQLAGS